MHASLWTNYAIYAWLLVPPILLAIAWRRNKREKLSIILLFFSSVVLLSATMRDVKWVLLGADYTNRLYVTIGLNLLLSILCGLYLAVTRRLLAALAGMILGLAWFYMGAVNSVV
jgi:hypothetical protein